MGRGFVWGILFVLIVGFVSANTITKNDINITSDKDTYLCEPVFVGDSCLIKAKITITNKKKSAVNLDGLSTFTTKHSKVKYFDSKGKVQTQTEIKNINSKGKVQTQTEIKNINSKGKVQTQTQERIPKKLFLGGQSKTYELQFFANKSGKFNYTVNIFQQGTGKLLATTTLDPFYNVTINASSPSYLLSNGVCMNESINDFENKTDITAGLNDGLDSTKYITYFASMPDVSIINGWSFNEYIFDNTLYSFSGDIDGTIFGNVETININPSIGDYYAGHFDGVNDYVRFFVGNELDIPDLQNFTMCLAFNTTMSNSGNKGIITKGDGGDGIYMRYKGDETIDCEFDGNTGSVIVSSGKVNDGLNHIICCRKHGNRADLWEDGVQVDTNNNNIGEIITSNNLFFGSEDLGTNLWEGDIRQIGFFNESLSDTELARMETDKSIADFNKGQAVHVFFNYTLLKDDQHKNYLAIKSDVNSLTTIRLMSYINMTHPNSSNFITDRISSGVSFIPIDNIIYNGYNYPFRFWGLQGRLDNYVEESYLMVSINDTTNPNITNCQINTTNLTCDGTVRLQCDVTDDGYIYQTWFSINNTAINTLEKKQANNNAGVYYFDKKMTGSYNETKELIWFLANATDLGGNYKEENLDFHINYTCIPSCTPNWQQQTTNCQINNSKLIYYTDSNNCGTGTPPPDNGTYLPCDYCSEDIVQNLGTCLWNGSAYTQEVTYNDNNYYSCCVFTGISSDCSILSSPYNETINQTCNNLNQDFDLSLDDIVYFGIDLKGDEKVYGKVYLNGTEDYSCVSYVKTPEGKLIQSNPIYEQATPNLLGVFGTRYEDREYFKTSHGIANVYWTKENLIIQDSLYVFGVECSSNSTHKISEKSVTVSYKGVSAPITRFVWIKQNIFGLMVGIMILILLLLAIFFIWRVGTK